MHIKYFVPQLNKKWVIISNMNTAATLELTHIYNAYLTLLPSWTFPLLPLAIGAVFQSFAWMSGPIFLNSFTLLPRMLLLWMFAGGEYLFMSPSMNIGVEVLGMSEPMLVVLYQVVTLVVFVLINVFVFKRPFAFKYAVSFMLLAAAVFVAYMW